MVTKWDKKPLEDHFDHNWALANELKKAGKDKLWQQVKRISEMANFVYIRQKGPYGNGTPVLCAANLVDDEPFVFVWGDDLVKSKVSFTKQMVKDYEKHGCPIIGVQEVPKEDVVRYGIVKLKNSNTLLIWLGQIGDENILMKRDLDFTSDEIFAQKEVVNFTFDEFMNEISQEYTLGKVISSSILIYIKSDK